MHRLIVTVTLGLGLILGFGLNASAESKLTDSLLKHLQTSNKAVGVIVQLHDVAPLPQFFDDSYTVRQRIQMLQYYRLESQQEMRDLVRDAMDSYFYSADEEITLRDVKFFWITNIMTATMSPAVLREIAAQPSVEKVSLDEEIRLIDGRITEESLVDEYDDVFASNYTYGLQRIGIPELWSRQPEIDGRGVVVGVIDTGIQADHPELKGKLQGFKDFVGNKSEPYDDNGHGTHVSGTIAGGNVNGTHIGVAPSAKILSAKVFGRGGSSSVSTLLKAMEWMVDPDGNPDTDDQPAVINNSWGGGMGSDSATEPFWEIVNRWIDMQIFPSFAAGNSGPGKSTVGRPGGYPQSFAVGATDSGDDIARFSSRGPVSMKVNGERKTYIKPDVSAPGVDVVSSYPGSRYVKLSGTSMATPHVTGAVAILHQIHPKLKVADAARILMETATDLGDSGKDNSFGMGRINLAEAAAVVSEMGLR